MQTFMPKFCSFNIFSPSIQMFWKVLQLTFVFSSLANIVSSKALSSNEISCEKWKTFKDLTLSSNCIPCSQCPDNYILVAHCEYDRDTLCRPITDLGQHFKSVVNSKVDEVKLLLASDNTTIYLVEKNTLIEKEEPGSSILVITLLSAFASGLLISVSLFILQKCRKRNEDNFNYHDPLQQSLLQEDNHEDEKPVLDLDILLAERYGKSLVMKNNYVP